MRPEELLQLIKRQPFIPLRIHVTTGQSYDIRHPDQAMVTKSRVDIGMAPDPQTGVLDWIEYLSLMHIVRIEDLKQVVGNGAVQ